MAKNPNQLGATAVWDGPLSEAGRITAPGNSRNHMEVSKYHVLTVLNRLVLKLKDSKLFKK